MKKNITLIIIYIITFIALFIMCKYIYASYKLSNMKPEEKIINRKIPYFVNYDSKFIKLKNITPGIEKDYKFIIENNSTDTIGKYKVSLKIIDAFSKVSDNDFTYSIESKSENNDKTNELFNVTNELVPMSTKEIGEGIITPGNTHTYIFKIKIKNDKTKNNYWKNKVFNAEIIIDNN